MRGWCVLIRGREEGKPTRVTRRVKVGENRVRSSQTASITREDEVKEAQGVIFNCRVQKHLA